MSSITKPVARQMKAATQFVNAAPDKAAPRKAAAREPRIQISVNIAPDVLRQLDEMAKRFGQTRAGLIGVGIARVLRDGL